MKTHKKFTSNANNKQVDKNRRVEESGGRCCSWPLNIVDPFRLISLSHPGPLPPIRSGEQTLIIQSWIMSSNIKKLENTFQNPETPAKKKASYLVNITLRIPLIAFNIIFLAADWTLPLPTLPTCRHTVAPFAAFFFFFFNLWRAKKKKK